MLFMDKLDLLVENMTAHNISNMIVSDPYSIRYLTQYYTQPSERLLALIVKQDGRHHLILNQLFPPVNDSNQIQAIYYQDGEDILSTIAGLLLPGKTSIDKFWPSHFLLELMQKSESLEPVNASYILDDLRSIKSEYEIEKMRQASKLNDKAMTQLIEQLALGESEAQMTHRLLAIYQSLGSPGFSFEPIIGYGPNAADPHHTTDQSLPKEGDTIVLDIGCLHGDYVSDMTRTVFYGTPNDKAMEIYNLVKKANETAIEMIKPGVKFSDIDAAARQTISQAGYGEFFTHRLGHFIGQEVHEAGDVSQFNHSTAQVGQVFSIEPGIYLPDELGVRIEDLVVVTEDGCEILNHVSKDPIIVTPRTN